jgi:hypothetical protein
MTSLVDDVCMGGTVARAWVTGHHEPAGSSGVIATDSSSAA